MTPTKALRGIYARCNPGDRMHWRLNDPPTPIFLTLVLLRAPLKNQSSKQNETREKDGYAAYAWYV